MLLCPKCQSPLHDHPDQARTLVCDGGHCFDRAKSGYVNLLLPGKGVHGDDKRMVQARRDFLSAGYYRPLMEQVARLCVSHLPEGADLLDSGCGEGSYTALLLRALSEAGRSGRIIGVDISKDAVDLAAKRIKAERTALGDSVRMQSEFAVASIFHLPLSDGSVGGIVNLFAPMAAEEYARVLAQDGFVLKVAPLPHHLMELKAAIYDEARLTDPEPDRWPGFVPEARGRVEFPIRLETNEAIKSLFTMTPYCYTTPERGLKRLDALQSLDVTAAFQWILHRKERV